MKVVGGGAAADHPGASLEQDARIDGESSSDDYRGGTKRGRAGGGGLGDTHGHESARTHSHTHTLQQFTLAA